MDGSRVAWEIVMDRAPNGPSLGLRAIAVLKGAKGVGALLGALGASLLVHRDVQSLAMRLLMHFQVDPASRYARRFLRLVFQATPGNLRWVMFVATLYAALQCIEAVGLWKCRRWAEWLTVSTGLIYVPFEVLAITRTDGWMPWLALATNLAIVLFLGLQLRHESTAVPSGGRYTFPPGIDGIRSTGP
jgi:uncharacterized membrane protein (DUF2068 family)